MPTKKIFFFEPQKPKLALLASRLILAFGVKKKKILVGIYTVMYA